MPNTPLDPASLNPGYAPVTVLDERMAVPVALPHVELTAKAPVSSFELSDVLEPDVITTGEVNLMVAHVEEAPSTNWSGIARIGSIAAHLVFIVFLFLIPKLFPYQGPSQAQVDMARQQLNFIYMPPDVRGTPRAPVAPRSPQVRIDPRVLKQVAPHLDLQPIPKPRVPEQAVREEPALAPPDLPAAPKPQVQSQSAPAPESLRPAPQATPEPSHGLILPRFGSPGRELEESAQEALHGGGAAVQSGGAIPGQGLPGEGGGGGGGEGTAGAGIQMLTPTEGVDFSSYLARVLASVKRNWYSVMPESARLGDKGRVVLQFRIMRNGAVPDGEPQLENGSGKEPLDRAAESSIRSSSPFEPLPSAFSSPYIELRFIFLYNLPLNYQ
jgi:TonB family protein